MQITSSLPLSLNGSDHKPTASGRTFTVKELAARWKIGADKIRSFLKRGELGGFNVALNISGKPQWRITAESVEQFEKKRAGWQPPPPLPRRRKQTAVDFYPD